VPFLSALEVVYDDALDKSTFTLLYGATSSEEFTGLVLTASGKTKTSDYCRYLVDC